MDESRRLLDKLRQHWPQGAWDVTTVVAVSGGADSVALLMALTELCPPARKCRLVVAHVNHNLRGEESEGDQQFVSELAAQGGVRFESRRVASSASDEDSLRNHRYALLTDICNEAGARYLALAHHAHDQAETVLQRLLRGTGPSGLAGIPPLRQLTPMTTIVRPLLTATRPEILDYLSHRGQPFREDASNSSTAYSRNKIRHELLPLLTATYNPQVVDALNRIAELMAEQNELAEVVAQQARDKIVIHSCPQRITLNRQALQETHRSLAAAALRSVWQTQNWPSQRMDKSKWDRLVDDLLDPNSKRRDVVADIYLYHSDKQAILERTKKQAADQ